jgi:hypothetical protein
MVVTLCIWKYFFTAGFAPCITSLKIISGVASQFAMQNSGIAAPEVEVYSSFAIPKSVKSIGI